MASRVNRFSRRKIKVKVLSVLMGLTAFCRVASAESVYVDAPPYNAVGNGLADDSLAIQNALNAAQVAGSIQGGRVYFSTGKTYRVTRSIVMPPFTSLVGTYTFSTATEMNWTSNIAPKICLSANSTLEMWGGCALRGLIIHREGLSGTVSNSDDFAGTAITMYRGDTTVENCAILGFNQGMYADPSDGISKQRVRLYQLNIDCNNGIKLLISKDISKLNDIHCYPYLTNHGDYADYRSGTAFWIGQDVAWVWLTDCYAYAYDAGYVLDGRQAPVNSATLYNCAAEAPVINGSPISRYGFRNLGTNEAAKLYHCSAKGFQVGVESQVSSGRTMLLYDTTIGNCQTGVVAGSGNLLIDRCTFRGLTAGSVGILLSHPSSRVVVNESLFEQMGSGINNADYNQLITTNNMYSCVTGTFGLDGNIDLDRDGLPDSWELKFGLNSGDAADRNSDKDGDGQTNWQEYLAGTNPSNPASFFSIGLNTGSPRSVLWTGGSNRTYRVLRSVDLVSWSTAARNIQPDSSQGEWRFPVQTDRRSQFFKVEAEMQ